MRRSPASDQFSTYPRSRRTVSSQESDDLPDTCQMPVMPGLTRSLLCTCDSYSATSLGSGGRGPTSDMSPLRTLKSWGSSSIEYRLMNLPIFVILGSLGSLNMLELVSSFCFCFFSSSWSFSEPTRMLRNLIILKGLPFLPWRS